MSLRVRNVTIIGVVKLDFVTDFLVHPTGCFAGCPADRSQKMGIVLPFLTGRQAMSILGMRSSKCGRRLFYCPARQKDMNMPTPPPEVTQEQLEDLYETICQARANFLEAKEKCFKLFCMAKRRQAYLQGRNKISKNLKQQKKK